MTTIKLPRLADRTPVKLAISLGPDLAAMLVDYAALYKQAYGQEEAVAELVPAMIRAFLESDRSFVRVRNVGMRRRS